MKNSRMRFVFCLFILFLSVLPCVAQEAQNDELRRTFISEYYIITPANCSDCLTLAASGIARKVAIDGKFFIVGSDKNKSTRKEILIGATNREDSMSVTDIGPMDYVIRFCPNGNIVILGGCISATVEAANVFANMIADGSLTEISSASDVEFRFFDHYELSPLADRDSEEFKAFVKSWLESRTVSAWGGFDRDIKESLYALTRTSKYNGEGRIASFSHRGDMSNFPENSLEGIICAVLSGADTMEFDFRITKDHIPVLIHDASLKRITNWEDMHGKNGLPDSEYVADWTYEQLMQLNLLDYYGNVTSSKPATLYEGMKLAAGIVQYAFDDKAKFGFGYKRDYFNFAKDTGSCASLILAFYRNMKGIDSLKGLISDDLFDFAVDCAASGKFRGCYAFYNDSAIFKSWDSNYISLNEDGAFWSGAVSKGKAYIGTNQIYKMNRFLEDEMGMKPWTY